VRLRLQVYHRMQMYVFLFASPSLGFLGNLWVFDRSERYRGYMGCSRTLCLENM
jgi:hypothetical protein